MSLIIVAAGIIITGIVFNFMLLFNKILIGRCRSVYFNTFMMSFVAPFKEKHQYWVGLLLLLRNLSYVTSEILNADGNPSYNLHFVFTLVVGLLLIKLIYVSMPVISLARIKESVLQKEATTDLTDRDDDSPRIPEKKFINGNGIIYKNPYLDILETLLLVNLLVLTYFTLHLREGNQAGQNILFTISASFVFIVFVGILVYHICVYTCVSSFLRKTKKAPANENMPLHTSGDNYGSTTYIHM